MLHSGTGGETVWGSVEEDDWEELLGELEPVGSEVGCDGLTVMVLEGEAVVGEEELAGVDEDVGVGACDVGVGVLVLELEPVTRSWPSSIV